MNAASRLFKDSSHTLDGLTCNAELCSTCRLFQITGSAMSACPRPRHLQTRRCGAAAAAACNNGGAALLPLVTSTACGSPGLLGSAEAPPRLGWFCCKGTLYKKGRWHRVSWLRTGL